MLFGSLDTTLKKKIPINSVLLLLGQHWTAEILMEGCLRGARQLYIRKKPVQCDLNTLGAIMHYKNA